MKKTKDALKKQEAEMLKQFNVEQLEERLEMKKWGCGKKCGIGNNPKPNGNGIY